MIKKIKLKLYTFLKKIFIYLYRTKKVKKVKNRNFTILTNTCMGGVIYHNLNMQFLSPTINLFMSEEDFFIFLRDLNHYLNAQLKLVGQIKKDDYFYPVCDLDGLTVHFNHSKSFEDAFSEWERRKARINFNNLYLIIKLDDNHIVSKSNIELCEQISNNFIFITNSINDNKYLCFKEKKWFNSDKFGIKLFEKKFNYARFLNKTKHEE